MITQRSQVSSARPGLVEGGLANACDALTWDNAPDILTVTEAAQLVRITPAAAYGAIQAGLLPAFNFGKRQTRIAKSALQKAFGICED